MANLLVVTGARRGLGSAIAIELMRRLAPRRAVLTARDGNEISAPGTYTALSADLATPQGVAATVDGIRQAAALAPTSSDSLWDLVLVHNAGSLGPMGQFSKGLGAQDSEATVFEQCMQSAALNTASFTALTSAFTEIAAGRGDGVAPSLVVNVSSLAAIEPFPSWGVYCAGKAYREMLMRVVAAEQGERCGVRTLSYAPGPLDTGMQAAIRDSGDVEPGLRRSFRELHRNGGLVDPAVSAGALAGVLEGGPSAVDALGGRVDLFDLLGGQSG